jgi:hypothetical protein
MMPKNKKKLMPQLRILMIFNGICRMNARTQARRRMRAGRPEKSHSMMYSQKEEVNELK